MRKDMEQDLHKEELRKRILNTAMEQFTSHGIRSVKMDSIAKLLGISKRTLYETYPNKEQLLLECVKLYEEQYDIHMSEYSNEPSHDVIDIISEFYRQQMKNLSDVNPAFFSDIERYKSVREFFDEKHGERKNKVDYFFKRGISEGLFRGDLDYNIVSNIAMSSIDHVMKSRMYEQQDITYILHNIMSLYFGGICTKSGLERLGHFKG